MYKAITGIMTNEFPNSWQSRTCYQLSKNNFTLEIKVTRINY
jgi:hypothetical protein